MSESYGPGGEGPLAGVSVIELAGLGPAQHGVMMLADAGARVVRVDRPATVGDEPVEGVSTELLARGRRSVALDLKSATGRELLERLLADADVLVDPYRAGVLERLGLDPERLCEEWPRLIVARMSGWGQEGPLAPRAGHDLGYLAIAGALEPIGEPDRPPPVPLNLVGDFGAGGMLLAYAISTALFERERSGRGQVVDVAMVDGIASLMTSIFQLDAGAEWDHARGSNWLQGGAPWYRAYATADSRFVTVAALEPQFYAALLEVLALDPEQWPQWDRERWPLLRGELEARFARATMAEWVDTFAGTDCCFAPVLRLDEVVAGGHMVERGTYVEVGGHPQPAPAPRFARTPGRIGPPPPWPGQHSAEVLAEAGVDDERLAELLAAGAVGARLDAAGRGGR